MTLERVELNDVTVSKFLCIRLNCTNEFRSFTRADQSQQNS